MKKLRPDNKHLPAPSDDHSRDLYDIPQAKRAEEILKNVFGQDKWVGLEESVKASIQHIGAEERPADGEVPDHWKA